MVHLVSVVIAISSRVFDQSVVHGLAAPRIMLCYMLKMECVAVGIAATSSFDAGALWCLDATCGQTLKQKAPAIGRCSYPSHVPHLGHTQVAIR